MQWLYARLHPDFAFKLAHAWSKNSRLSKKTRGPEFDAEKEGIYKFALSVLKKEEVDYFVFGHRHRIANVSIGQKSRFILLGEWIETFSYGVFDGEQFNIRFYKALD
jgi:UDP-2,3-diacylglucosamine hydrolase